MEKYIYVFRIIPYALKFKFDTRYMYIALFHEMQNKLFGLISTEHDL
jgi:hypothetical protein